MKQFIKDVMKSLTEDLALTWHNISKWMIIACVLLAGFLAFSDANADHHMIYAPAMLASHIIIDPPILYQETPEEQSKNDLYTEESHPDEYCIALNVYYEARADNLAGKYAVADVVLNRVADTRFEDTACKVIREGIMYESWSTAQHEDLKPEERVYFPKRDRCQFSWFCDGKADEPTQLAAWRESQIIAYNIVQFGTFRGITEGSTHYHATYVAPDWSLEIWRYAYHLIGRIGSHIFYKWV